MKVSIITPSYNQGQFIERTLTSVANQDGAEIEHLVMDGGSTDDTVSILKDFTPRVQWVSKKDRGQTDAVNQGLRASTGEIIGWLNSDDVYYQGAVSSVVDYFLAHPEVDIVYGLADHIDVNDQPFEDYPTENWNYERLKVTCFICQPALFMRRRVIETYGLLDESLHYCMDYAYWLKLAKSGARFAQIEKKLAGSRLYAENKTLGSRVKVHTEINDMLKSLLGKVPDRWLINYAHVVVEQRVTRDTNPQKFLFCVGARAVAASLKWNRRISMPMFKTITSWVPH